jgi:hypothetical protein
LRNPSRRGTIRDVGLHTSDGRADREAARREALAAGGAGQRVGNHATPVSTGGERGGERNRERERERERARREALGRTGGGAAGPPDEEPPGDGGEGRDAGGQDAEVLELISRAETLTDAAALRRLIAAAKHRIKELGKQSVVEVREHRSGVLQLEYREAHGRSGRRGPYWTYRWVEDGRRRSIYLGKTDDPEAALEEKLASP